MSCRGTPNPFTFLNPAPTAEANKTQQPLNPALEGVAWIRPHRGAPPGTDLGAPAVRRVSPAGSPSRRRRRGPRSTPSTIPGFRRASTPASTRPLPIPPEVPSGPADPGTRCRCGPSTGPFRRSWSSAATASPSCSATTTSSRSTSRRTAASGGTRSAPTSTTGTTGRRTTASPGAYFYPGPVLRLPLADRAGGHSAPSTPPPPIPRPRAPDGSGGIDQDPGRLARDHEHALVPRPHVQLHLAERVQGQRRDVQHLQRPGPRQRGDQRRREPAAAERHGE